MVKEQIFMTLNDRNYFLKNYLKDNLPKVYYQKAFQKKIKQASYIQEYELTEEYEKNILHFWKPYEKINLVWHKAFTAISGIEDVHYIPEDVFYKTIEPALNRYDMALPYVDKNMSDKLFSDFKLPATIVRNMNGSFYDVDYNLMNKEEALKSVQNYAREYKFIIKPSIDSGAGKNVQVLDYRGQTTASIQRNFILLFKEYGKDFIVQEFLYQHPLFHSMHESSLNTLRLTTLRLDQSIHVLSGVVRMGNNGSYTDNAESGCITCGFDAEGRLLPYATNHWNYEKYEEHPYSHFTFKDTVLPSMKESIELVKTAHQKLIYFDLVSWDIAIDRFGEPYLIEIGVNIQDINYHQRTNGPLFGKVTKEVLDKVYRKEK